MRIRQIALVARRLDPVVDELCQALGIQVAFRDPGVDTFGLRNAVMAVGDTFLEVVSPVRDDTTAGRFLDRRGGDGGYMVIVQTDDLAADRTRLAALGVRIVWEIALDDIATIHLHPRDVGGAILSLDQPRPPDSWRWAGPDWQSAASSEVSASIVGVDLQARDPAAMAARWSQVLGRPGRERDAGRHEILLEGSSIAFVPEGDERGEAVAAVRVRAAGTVRGDFRICGTRIILE